MGWIIGAVAYCVIAGLGTLLIATSGINSMDEVRRREFERRLHAAKK